MDFLTFSHYYASLIEPRVRKSRDTTTLERRCGKRKLRHYSPWKVALLNDTNTCEKLERNSGRKSPGELCCYDVMMTSHGAVTSSGGDLVDYCLQLLDKYSMMGSYQSLQKTNSSRSLGNKCCLGSLCDVASIQRDAPMSLVTSCDDSMTSHESTVTSHESIVTSRESSVTPSVDSSVESPLVSSYSLESFSSESVLQTLNVRLFL